MGGKGGGMGRIYRLSFVCVTWPARNGYRRRVGIVYARGEGGDRRDTNYIRPVNYAHLLQSLGFYFLFFFFKSHANVL